MMSSMRSPMSCEKSSHRLPQVTKEIRELTLRAAFVHVIIPSAGIDEGDFQTDVRFVELRYLLHGLSHAIVGIVRTIFGLKTRRVGLAKHIDSFKRFGAGPAQRLVDTLGVECLKATPSTADDCEKTRNCFTSGKAIAGAEPRRVSGRFEPMATARNGEAFGSGIDCRLRLSQPSSVAFTPGVPDSM